MSLTREAKDQILSKAFTEGALFDSESFWVGLWCSPIVDSFGTPINIGEVTEDDYSRAEIPNNGTVFSEVFEHDVRNNVEILFNEAQSDWGIITNVGIFDAETEGNLLFYGTLDTAREVVEGDIVRFPAASLRFGFS